MPTVRQAMCPRCKRIVDVKESKNQEIGLYLQTHDGAPPCRMVCQGSGEPVSYEGAGAAADEIVRLRAWLRSIAYTPHLGCTKAPTNVKEILEQVDMAEEIHGKGENPNCGACKAQAALSGREAP